MHSNDPIAELTKSSEEVPSASRRCVIIPLWSECGEVGVIWFGAFCSQARVGGTGLVASRAPPSAIALSCPSVGAGLTGLRADDFSTHRFFGVPGVPGVPPFFSMLCFVVLGVPAVFRGVPDALVIGCSKDFRFDDVTARLAHAG